MVVVHIVSKMAGKRQLEPQQNALESGLGDVQRSLVALRWVIKWVRT